MEAKDARGYCESCDTFTVGQTKDLLSLENTCPESKGILRIKCPRWKKEEVIEEVQSKEAALAFTPKKVKKVRRARIKKVEVTVPEFQEFQNC
jgi:hypothetical protein